MFKINILKRVLGAVQRLENATKKQCIKKALCHSGHRQGANIKHWKLRYINVGG